jgi:hypothetical protein
MASGCAVVGYHGFGGLEYATNENGFWSEEGNPTACAQMLGSVIEMFLGGEKRVRAVIEGGIRTAAKYTLERQENEIVEFMSGVISGAKREN